MATPWTRIRVAYLGGFKTSTILGAVLAVGVLGYITLQLIPSRPKIHVMYKSDPPPSVRIPSSKAKEFVEYHMKDTRPEMCKSNGDEVSGNMPVSIILHFKDEEFYKMVYTVISIIKNTKHEDIKELIVLDDGTKNQKIKESSAQFLRDLDQEYDITISHFGSYSTEGAAAVRMKAVRVANGDVLVFLDSNVVVNKGWLDPLVAHLTKHPKTIAVPHIDNILKPDRFFQLPESYGTIFGWSMNTYWYDTFQKTDKPFATAIMRGNVFAVQRDFLTSLGSFDEGLGSHGGENLELSLRTWLCGGTVEIVPCSRVAVRDAMGVLHIADKDNIHRIAELWFGETKHYIYRFAGIHDAMDATKLNAVRMRKSYLAKHGSCEEVKDIDWYLNAVVGDLPKPSKDTRLFGKLRTDSGHCAKSTEKDHLILVPCVVHFFDRDMIFNFLDNGQLEIDGQCIQGNDYAKEVSVRDCDDKNQSQMWEHSSSGLLRLKGTSYCIDFTRKRLTEAPDINLQKCEVGVSHSWTFVVI